MYQSPSAGRRVQTISFLGSYVPRQCGIATFSKDLRNAIAAEIGEEQATVLAIDDNESGYAYPSEVRFEIPAQSESEYVKAAELLNMNRIDVALVQHEFGIYGGRDGCHVLEFMRRLRMPIMSTLHTVLAEPTPSQRAVLRELTRISDRVVVMSHLARNILREVYGTPEEKVVFIPHGIPDVPFVDPNFHKDQFGVEGRLVMLTFGLLSKGKGVDVAIRALPKIVERYPQLVYIVLGATHPHVLKREGSSYRDSLERLVDLYGLRDHVKFHNHFVSIEELCGYIGAADVYVTPYLSKAQITSGTLAYALGAGKAVVSTPYWYAEEMLAEGRGRLFPFNDSDALAETVIDLLDNESERHMMRKRAYVHGRQMVWKEVAQRYVETAHDIVSERVRRPRRSPNLVSAPPCTRELPVPALTHMLRLTDNTGILQHAVYSIPDRTHGYCTDDNARALITALRYYDMEPDMRVLRAMDTYLAFLHHAFNPEHKRFRNFMNYERGWLEDVGSEDVHGRALCALGLASALAPNDGILSFATRLFNSALESVESLGSPRAWAFTLVGIHSYLQRFSGDTQARRIRAVLSERVFKSFELNATADWPWCEDIVTYCNAKLPHALILSGQWIPDQRMLERGLEALEWLIRLQFTDDGGVSLIGNDGWLRRNGQRARFDQQPIDAMELIEACAEAFRSTQDRVWTERAHRCMSWFQGNNDTKSVLYDAQTAGCRDGLHSDGPNLNEGAESTLAWLISLLTLKRLAHDVEAADASERAEQEQTVAREEEPTAALAEMAWSR